MIKEGEPQRTGSARACHRPSPESKRGREAVAVAGSSLRIHSVRPQLRPVVFILPERICHPPNPHQATLSARSRALQPNALGCFQGLPRCLVPKLLSPSKCLGHIHHRIKNVALPHAGGLRGWREGGRYPVEAGLRFYERKVPEVGGEGG